jgi:hypothetical protein
VEIMKAFDRRQNGLGLKIKIPCRSQELNPGCLKPLYSSAIPAYLCNVINIHGNCDVLFHIPGMEVL